MSLDHEEKEFLKNMAQESPAPKARAREAAPAAGAEQEVHRYQVVRMLSEDGNKIEYKPHGPWVVMADVHEARINRLQAEIADLIEARDSRVTERLAAFDALSAERDALKAASDFNFKQAQENAEERDKVSAHRAEVIAEREALEADRDAIELNLKRMDNAFANLAAERDALQSELTKERELSPVNWPDRQVLDFLGVALRNVDLVGEVRLSEIRQGFQFMQERQPAPTAKGAE